MMKPGSLALRNLAFYRSTSIAVVLGVATAVAVLSGALLVGDSVRGSLRDQVLRRLGNTGQVLLSAGFFRERLAAELESDPEFPNQFKQACPLLMMPGFVTVQNGSRSAGNVLVYGVDERFWRFHGITMNRTPQGREAYLSPALAAELNTEQGSALLVRVRRPSGIPLESLHGDKNELGHTIRVSATETLSPANLGTFSLQAQQGNVLAIFLPMTLLQDELGLPGKANAVLVSLRAPDQAATTAALEALVRRHVRLEDLGMKVQPLDSRHALSLDAEGGFLKDAVVSAVMEAAGETDMRAEPVFAYLANTLLSGDRAIPYSLVAAVDFPGHSGSSSIMLNEWAARDLQVSVGDMIRLEYDVWEEPGRLAAWTAEFRLAKIVPVDRSDADLVPVYPGITDSESFVDWDPPFHIDLRRIRPIDERYWEQYRTTPKAYISFEEGRRLWGSRFGSQTSMLLLPDENRPLADSREQFEKALASRFNPLALDMAVRNVRVDNLEAANGATNFGAYFVYFSFFLVASTLLLVALFFRLGTEQRASQVGLLRAVGFGPAVVRRLFLMEGLWLSIAGGALGVLGGLGYAWLMMAGLRTWWVDAVGTTALAFHPTAFSIAAGALGGVVASLACILLTLRRLSHVSERRLLAGQLEPEADAAAGRKPAGRRRMIVGSMLALLGLSLLAAAMLGMLNRDVSFLLAGTALLASLLVSFDEWLVRLGGTGVRGAGWSALSRLGISSAMYRPARALTAMSMIASASFILVAVDSFRKEQVVPTADPKFGTGGYSLLAESLLPVVYDPAVREGRDLLGLSNFDSVTVEPFRLRPGDDASCLNLYEPTNPRILAPTDRFLAEGRFSFRSSLATNDDERANPWLLLRKNYEEDVVPVIADANSMTYILHRKLGEEIELPVGDRMIRLRLVAALDDSALQGELLMSQANFIRLFPEEQGYRFFLVGAQPEQSGEVASAMEEALADFGADVRPTAQRLEEFHRVENTYITTFQMLGGLGLLLGTLGLGAVLFRNILERRRELALLRALGYRRGHVFVMILSENGLILLGGLFIGVVCASLAIAPALLDQGGGLPARALWLSLLGVLASGLLTSLVVTQATLRSSLLGALRAE